MAKCGCKRKPVHKTNKKKPAKKNKKSGNGILGGIISNVLGQLIPF
jgi:hypothetical protein